MSTATAHPPHIRSRNDTMGLFAATMITAANNEVIVTADRLTENFALTPTLIESDHGPMLSTENWSLLHLASGRCLFRLGQYNAAGQPMCLNLHAVRHFAQWLETVGGWTTITDLRDLNRIPMNDRQARVLRQILSNPNRAIEILAEYTAAQAPLTPGSARTRQPSVAHIARTELRARRTRSELDPNLQFVPPTPGYDPR